MKREEALLQQALNAARSKHELTARDLFLEVVELNPHNETAWMWLSGLLDELDDCIHACERVLEINPQNEKIRRYLIHLQGKKQAQREEQKQKAESQVRRAVELAKAGKHESALSWVREAAQLHDPGLEGWRLLAEHSPDAEEQSHALQKVLLSPHRTQKPAKRWVVFCTCRKTRRNSPPSTKNRGTSRKPSSNTISPSGSLISKINGAASTARSCA
jgi:tetratricopeptide (TPR) repeat protein